MKKSVYYILLVLLWIATVLVLAILLLLLGLSPIYYSLWEPESLGRACGHPQLWLMAIGIVLLLRPIMWKLVAKESKKFKKSTAIIVLVVGIVWLSLNVAARIRSEQISEELIKNANEYFNREEADNWMD